MLTLEQLLERGRKSEDVIRTVSPTVVAQLVRQTLSTRQRSLVMDRLERIPLYPSLSLSKSSDEDDILIGVYGGWMVSALCAVQTITGALKGDATAMKNLGSIFEKPRATPDDVSKYLIFIRGEIAYLDDEVTSGVWNSWKNEGCFTTRLRISATTDKNQEEAERTLARLFWAALREQDYGRMYIGLSAFTLSNMAFADKYALQMARQWSSEEIKLRDSLRSLESETKERASRLKELGDTQALLERQYAELQKSRQVSQSIPEAPKVNGTKDDKAAARIASLEQKLRESGDALKKAKEDYASSISLKEKAERERNQAQSQIEDAQHRVRVMDTLLSLRGKRIALIGGDNWAKDKVSDRLGRYGIEVSHLHQGEEPSLLSSRVAGAMYVILNSAFVSHKVSNAMRAAGIKFYMGPKTLETIEDFVAALVDPSLEKR